MLPTHSNRQRSFIFANIFLIILIAALFPLGGFIYSLLGLLLLGAIQLISALAGAIRGNKAKGFYLLASVLFLAIYIGSIAGYIPIINVIIQYLPDVFLSVFAPLIMAVIYTCILIVTPSGTPEFSPKKNDELLDDEVF